MRESIPREYHVLPKPRKPSNSVRFQTGAKVRVKSGIRDPDPGGCLVRTKVDVEPNGVNDDAG